MSSVDVVIVSYNSRAKLRACVEPLADTHGITVVVVDNNSHDGTLTTVSDLPLTAIPQQTNVGFGAACNIGWRRGTSPYVLFLNPDARTTPEAVRALAGLADEQPAAAAFGPKLVTPHGTIDYSLRRFPRLRSTYSRALFLQRFLPRSNWVDEVVRDPEAYAEPHSVEWVTGACMLVRRSALEEIEGFDERFFMYCEDKDLCARLWQAGYEVAYEPRVVCEHEGGAGSEATRGERRSMLTRSRLLYAAAHSSRIGAAFEALGLGLEAGIRLLTGPGGLRGRLDRFGELRVIARSFRSSAGSYPIG